MNTNENEQIKFMVSGRELKKDALLTSLTSLYPYLRKYFGSTTIESVYSSVQERSPLYGGRHNDNFQSFSIDQVNKLNKAGIGFSLTLSNHYFTKEAYRQTIPILEKIENPLNSVAIANDELAMNLQCDFPKLKRKASVIRMLLTKDEISNALEIYDFVTLMPWLNDQPQLLASLPEKHRLIPFANAACLYKCRVVACYKRISYCFINSIPFDQDNSANKDIPKACPNTHNPIRNTNLVFDIKAERFKDFRLFKIIPVRFNQKPEVVNYDYIALP